MNRQFGAIWALITAGVAIVAGAIGYYAGQASHVVTTTTGADGRVLYPGYWGFGFPFFPFFGIFWILLIGFLIYRFAFGRPWRGGYGYWHQHPAPGDSTPPTVPPQQTTV